MKYNALRTLFQIDQARLAQPSAALMGHNLGFYASANSSAPSSGLDSQSLCRSVDWE